jgi:hypothetical protein
MASRSFTIIPEGPVDPSDFKPTPLWLPTFLLPLSVTPLDDGINWKVNGTFLFESQTLQRIITILDGFLTDFASTPKFLWNILPPWGKYGKGSVIHDFLYRTPGQATKDQADSVFLECMIVSGVSKEVRNEMYEGVHLFGASSYKGGL